MFKTVLCAMVLAASAAFFCGGCSSPWSQMSKNVENSKKLRIGMTKEQVLKIMGEPLSKEAFCTPDIWFYYVNMVWGDGLITEDECLPLVFKAGKLAGWGRDYYIRNVKLRPKTADALTRRPQTLQEQIQSAKGKPEK